MALGRKAGIVVADRDTVPGIDPGLSGGTYVCEATAMVCLYGYCIVTGRSWSVYDLSVQVRATACAGSQRDLLALRDSGRHRTSTCKKTTRPYMFSRSVVTVAIRHSETTDPVDSGFATHRRCHCHHRARTRQDETRRDSQQTPNKHTHTLQAHTGKEHAQPLQPTQARLDQHVIYAFITPLS